MTIDLSIIIPVYNEEEYIRGAIKDLKKILEEVTQNFEIIISDNNSTDRTKEILKEFDNVKNIKLNFRQKNEGKGANLIDGIKIAEGNIVIFFDGDLEYDSEIIKRIIKCFKLKNPDVVLGSRFLQYEYKATIGFLNLIANKILTISANILYFRNYSDIETAVKAFKKEKLLDLNLKSKGFQIENEIIAKISRKNYKVIEIPVIYFPRTYAEGKKVMWWDFFKSYFSLIIWRFKFLK